MSVIRFGLLLTGLLFAVVAAGHHSSIGIYDPDDIGEVEGQITSVFWRNPHIRLEISRVGEDGENEIWQVELGSVNTAERIGITRSVLNVGDRITLSGSLGRNNRKTMFADSIILSSGADAPLRARTFEERYGMTPEEAIRVARSSDPELRDDIFRVWFPNGFSSYAAGGQYPLTEAGRRAQADWDPQNDPALRCIPPGFPTMMPNPYPIEFVNQGETILIRFEEWDGTRTIHMSDAGSQQPARSSMGYSAGRWEGRDLVIETTDIDWPYIDDLGTPQSEDVHITERFTLTEDGAALHWEAQITDPINFTRPVVMDGNYIWISNGEIRPYNCSLPI